MSSPSFSAAGPLVVTVGACLVGACSLLTSLDGYAGPDPDDSGGDAQTSGGPPIDTAADTPPQGPAELHPNGTFETTLAPWSGLRTN